jgi:uncharacterized protein YcbX
VIDSTEAEDTWIGRTISSGAFKGIIQERTKRCGMTMVAQPGLSEEADILRTIVKTGERCLGVYATVATDGMVALGDTISVT